MIAAITDTAMITFFFVVISACLLSRYKMFAHNGSTPRFVGRTDGPDAASMFSQK